MNSKRLAYAFVIVMFSSVALFGLGAYWSIKILKNEGQKLVELKLADSILNKQQQGLAQAKRDIAKYSDLEEISKSIIPADKDQASTIAEISTMASQSGITLGSIEFPQSALGQVKKKGSKTQNTDSSKSQLTELTDLKGTYVMEININSHSTYPITYEQLIKYLKLLESSRRTAQVTNIDITPDSKQYGRYQFQLTLNTYVRPE